MLELMESAGAAKPQGPPLETLAEPGPDFVAPEDDTLAFCLQKHASLRPHYDLRLELDGVLKSWALPLGPSMHPRQRRLAVTIDDQPLSYLKFEGCAAAGDHTVMLWDEGYYEIEGQRGRARMEAALRQGLHLGQVDLTLRGKKLQGAFSLLRLPPEAGRVPWVLVKRQDPHATAADILLQDRSVMTDRDMDAIAGSLGGRLPRPRRPARKEPKAPVLAKLTVTEQDAGSGEESLVLEDEGPGGPSHVAHLLAQVQGVRCPGPAC